MRNITYELSLDYQLSKLRNDEFGVITCICRGNEYKIILIRCGYGTYLIQNIRSGDRRGIDWLYEHPFAKAEIECAAGVVFDSSWSTCEYPTLRETLNDLLPAGADFRFEEIVEEFGEQDESEENARTKVYDELMSKNYSNDTTYVGMGEYHENHGCEMNEPNKPYKYRFGVELEVEFPNEEIYDEFCGIPSNWFYREEDGSLGEWGVEIISVPLLPKDAKSERFWKPLIDTLKAMKAKSWDTGRCGLHIHVSKEIFGNDKETQENNLGKVLYLYHQYLKEHRANIKIYGRECGYSASRCNGKTPESGAVKLLGNGVLKDANIKDKVKKSLIDKSSCDRYFDINLCNIESIGTIEFRKGKGSINTKRIVAVVEWCELMCLYTNKAKWVDISLDNFFEFAKAKAKSEMIINALNS